MGVWSLHHNVTVVYCVNIFLLTMPLDFVISINRVSKPTWILDIEGNFTTFDVLCTVSLPDCICANKKNVEMLSCM